MPFGLRLQHAVFDLLVYRKLRAAFGGNLRFAFSGGAPLSARLTHFFNGVGIQIYECYGLTETSPVLTTNRPGAWRIGSVGQPVPGTRVRTGADGELLAEGGQVFGGYWQNEAATAETFTADGWFRTGDLGDVDQDGYVWITGRKKELIVTAGGKNVASTVLEDRLKAHPLVSQAVVIGDQRPFIAALVTIDEEAFADWAIEQGVTGKSVADLAGDDLLRAEVRAAVEEANRAVSQAESVREFRILGQDFTIEGGELTPTFKVRRAVVATRYATQIEELYGR